MVENNENLTSLSGTGEDLTGKSCLTTEEERTIGEQHEELDAQSATSAKGSTATRPEDRSGSRPPTSTSLKKCQAKCPRQASRSKRSWGSRVLPGSCPTSTIGSKIWRGDLGF